jgi:hypothetical protein
MCLLLTSSEREDGYTETGSAKTAEGHTLGVILGESLSRHSVEVAQEVQLASKKDGFADEDKWSFLCQTAEPAMVFISSRSSAFVSILLLSHRRRESRDGGA